MRPSRPWLFGSVLVGLLAFTLPAFSFDEADVETVFAIRKSSNRNRVDYGLHLDGACHPEGDDPLTPYWRRLERGPGVVRDLSILERTVYGVRSQTVRVDERGSRVTVRLRALPDRTITIRTERSDDGCRATPVARILGNQARLTDIFVVLDGPRSVNHIEITGRALQNGQELREILEP